MIAYALLGFLALIAIASVTVYLRYHRDMDVSRARLASIPTEVYTSKYGDIEYRLVGNGPVVLVSHGVTGGVDQGITITDSFVSSGEGYRFLYVSRFGYLKSSAPPNDASARLQAAAYKDLLDHLGIDQVFVFGNSAGGPSSMWFAIDFPERTRGLILLSSAAPTSGPPPAIPPRLVFENDFLYWAVVKVVPDTLVSVLLPEDILSTLTTEEKASLIKNVFVFSLPVSERTEGINFDNHISTPSVTDIPFEQIKVPTLILQAVDDPREREGGSELAERIADSKLVGLTGGHFLLREEKKVQTEIAEFIAKNQ
ncbi:MAG TPA: alpha/beta hydrolase [Anaerolineales bacterium]|nr:alpha/beta hydrolase [Anaerolineales bacterium]